MVVDDCGSAVVVVDDCGSTVVVVDDCPFMSSINKKIDNAEDIRFLLNIFFSFDVLNLIFVEKKGRFITKSLFISYLNLN